MVTSRIDSIIKASPGPGGSGALVLSTRGLDGITPTRAIQHHGGGAGTGSAGRGNRALQTLLTTPFLYFLHQKRLHYHIIGPSFLFYTGAIKPTDRRYGCGIGVRVQFVVGLY